MQILLVRQSPTLLDVTAAACSERTHFTKTMTAHGGGGGVECFVSGGIGSNTIYSVCNTHNKFWHDKLMFVPCRVRIDEKEFIFTIHHGIVFVIQFEKGRLFLVYEEFLTTLLCQTRVRPIRLVIVESDVFDMEFSSKDTIFYIRMGGNVDCFNCYCNQKRLKIVAWSKLHSSYYFWSSRPAFFSKFIVC